MNLNLTEIAYVLDRSGSMEPMREAAISAFNVFLRSQMDVPGDVRLTLVQFDDSYEVPVAARPIQDVELLTAATYEPRGSTALLDAIGRTVNDTQTRLASLPEQEHPGKVVIAVFTDGFENASRSFSSQQISDLIRQMRESKGWEFLFLAANQDAIASASAMQMNAHHSANVEFCYASVTSSGSAMSRKIRAMRLRTSGQMDEQAMADEAKSMDEIMREEEKQVREDEERPQDPGQSI